MATAPNLDQSKGQLNQAGTNALGTGQASLNKGLSDFGPALDYWNKILSGNSAEMQNAIAPEKDNILASYRAKRKQLAATGSRSGGTNEATAQSEYSQAGDVAGLLQKLRPEAAKATSDIAGKEAQLGLGESEMGMSALSQLMQGGVAERGQTLSFISNVLSTLI
jgi:hypothetical protein